MIRFPTIARLPNPSVNSRPFAFGPALAPLISIVGMPFKVEPAMIIPFGLIGGKGLVTFMVCTPDPGMIKCSWLRGV